MYEKSFFLEKDRGNNAFSYLDRENKSLYVPSLVQGTFDTIELGNKVVFEDHDFEGKLQSCCGLQNFYEIQRKNKTIILFDNHNHAYFFWWKWILETRGSGGKKSFTLIHIDEHSDMRDPGTYLDKNPNLQEIFDYTNYFLNVGNYIIPAIHDEIIDKEVIQIRDTRSLEEYFELDFSEKETILNLDLDIFEPELDFISETLKKEVILDAAEKASFITVATSPFFINQERAIRYFKEIFS